MNRGKLVFLVPVLVIILSTIFYVVFISSFNNLGTTNSRFLNLIEEYENLPQNSSIFLGDSQIRENIDCLIIDKNCVNFGLAGILPLQIALQKDLILSAKPKRVIFGVSPLFFNEDVNNNNDIYFLINDKASSNNLLNEEEKKLLSMNDFDRLLYKRKFILPFYINLIKNNPNGKDIKNNFKNPHFFTEKQSKEELIKKLNQETINFFKTSERQKNSFTKLVEDLKEYNIEVRIIQMPLHPLLIERINLENYHLYISNFKTLNLEEKFSEEDFIDLTHLNEQGRDKLSKILKGDKNII